MDVFIRHFLWLTLRAAFAVPIGYRADWSPRFGKSLPDIAAGLSDETA